MPSPIVLRYPGAPGLTGAAPGASLSRLDLESAAWSRGDLDLPALDERIDELAAAGPFAVAVHGEPAGAAAGVDVHLQRWSGRRNEALPFEEMTRLLVRLRELHPADKPLVRADYRHALDVWQWVLRLEPAAGGAVQIAALFHDVERVFTEAEVRSEQTIAAYDDYKARHAARSAAIIERILAEEGCEPALRTRAAALIAGHDQPGRVGGTDGELLEDADALSFFSLNCPGYLRYYGAEQARRKIDWTLERLSRRGRTWLDRLGLAPAPDALNRRSPSGEEEQPER